MFPTVHVGQLGFGGKRQSRASGSRETEVRLGRDGHGLMVRAGFMAEETEKPSV